ncbi:MAG TPA: protein phosphatase 2C domain-containing protein, partial [Nitrospiria bacterium]|nr:protein phosphatase 2C domain-containing protein [Nitrospiria bacterium]
NPDEVTWPEDLDPELPYPIKRLIAAGKLANSKIFHTSQADSKLSGMGTTMVCVLIEDDKAYVAHVGDSRAYLVRNGTIDQVTGDHSLINDYIQQGILKPEEAEQHPLKHVITRALGSNLKVEVDVKTVPLSGDDTFLLCSDGLSNLVNGQEMKESGLDAAPDLESACGKLVELANDRGGDDNITIVLVSNTKK